MNTSNIQSFVGIDIGADHFAASIFFGPEKPLLTQDKISNDPQGFEVLIQWLQSHHCEPHNSVICMEATGVYGEHLTYFLVAQGYFVTVEPPLRVKRAFNPSKEKTDPVDSQQIAQYAYRFLDQLHPFTPPEEILLKIKALLTLREHFVQHRTANYNSKKQILKSFSPQPEVLAHLTQAIDALSLQIQEIEKQIQNLIQQNPHYQNKISLIQSIPGVGLLLSANLLILTQGFRLNLNHKQAASYIGISPKRFQSGSSIRRKTTSSGLGPAPLRKLLYLASMSLRTHNQHFKRYYLSKVAEGKSPKLVLNNIANKLLKIIFAISSNQKQFHLNHRSLNPSLFHS